MRKRRLLLPRRSRLGLRRRFLLSGRHRRTWRCLFHSGCWRGHCSVISEFAVGLQKHEPKDASGNNQHHEAQQEDQQGLASFPIPVKGGRIGKDAINSHRVGDVLDLTIAERLVSTHQFMFYLLVNTT